MELEIIKLVQSTKNLFLDTMFLTLSYCASFFAVCIVFVMLFFINKKYSFKFVFVVCLNIGINYLLKVIINRPRPYQVDFQITNSLQALGNSFPSGHMVCATTIVFFFVLVFYKNIKHIWLKILFMFLCGLYLIGVAISRMYLGQHYLSDIIAGTVLGVVLCLFFMGLIKVFNNHFSTKTR